MGKFDMNDNEGNGRFGNGISRETVNKLGVDTGKAVLVKVLADGVEGAGSWGFGKAVKLVSSKFGNDDSPEEGKFEA